MKVYQYGENFTMERLRKKKKDILHEDSNIVVFKVKSRLWGELLMVDMPLINRVCHCDKYEIRGNSVILTALEDKDITIVDTMNGKITKASRYEAHDDLAIVTLATGQRKFMSKNGVIEDGNIRGGGFRKHPNSEEYGFVDLNGNYCANNEYFVALSGDVCAGKPALAEKEEGVYSACSFEGKQVYYSFLGNTFDWETDATKYKHLYEFYTGKRKLTELNDNYLVDSQVYNFVIDIVRDSMQSLADDVYRKHSNGYSASTTIQRELNAVLKSLQNRRDKVIAKYVEGKVEKYTENGIFAE